MHVEPVPVEIGASPELLRLVREVERTGVAHALVRGGETVAIVTPIATGPTAARRSHKVRPQPELVFNIIGMGASAEPGDVDRFKDQYLADAIDRRHR